ncbi:c-type cytochrome [Lutibacter maritimus]|uniref:Cytochrome c n=1 Tax=Lutibacter maritimus TaxID=593133 RepID=A0A1I6S2F6_9FLAO|nr:cytochrome c [Lutibacter maritimus]SFS71109.1 Cytochrome c [Lutibacter maritimus]
MKTFKILMIIGVVSVGLLSFTKLVQEEWKVPAKYQTMKNPIEASKSNVDLGKTLYAKHCKSCHGKEGLGDGPKAEEVDGNLGDFSSKKFQAQTDGALFYKSYFGRDDMPSYEKKMPEKDDMWAIVHYLRTLKK